MARRTRTPNIKWLAYTVHVRRNIISRRAVWQPLFTFIMNDLCQLGSGIPVYLSPVIPLSVSMFISASVRFLVLLSFIHILHVNGSTSVLYARKVGQNGRLSVRKRRKSIPPAYHTPKNRPPGVRTPNSKSLTEALDGSNVRVKRKTGPTWRTVAVVLPDERCSETPTVDYSTWQHSTAQSAEQLCALKSLLYLDIRMSTGKTEIGKQAKKTQRQ